MSEQRIMGTTDQLICPRGVDSDMFDAMNLSTELVGLRGFDGVEFLLVHMVLENVKNMETKC